MAPEKTILVTGANGFIGLHVIEKLRNENCKIAITIRNKSNKTGFEGIEVDLSDRNKVEAAFKNRKFDIVIHLAGSVNSKDSFQEMMKNNFEASKNLLDALNGGFEKFVTLGSGAEYGANSMPCREGEDENPVNAYGWSKFLTTSYCRALYKTLGQPIAILRPSTVYGQKQKGTMLVPTIVESLKNGLEAKLTAGEQSKDFIYVDDVANAIVKTAFSGNETNGETINISSNSEDKIKDVANKIGKLMKKENLIKLGAMPSRKGEQLRHCMDNSKAKKLLNWKPNTTLEEGLKKTIESLE